MLVERSMNRMTLVLLLVASFSAATGQLLFKIGAKGRTEILSFVNLPVFAGLVFYALSTLLWIYVLSFEKLVNVYAFTALTFVLVYLGGVVLLGESINVMAATGVGVVLIGLYLIVSHSA